MNENADSAKVGGEKRGEVMAEEEDRVVENQRVQDNNSPSITNALGLDSPEAPNILANNSFIDVSASDVTVVFLQDFGVGDRRIICGIAQYPE